MPVQHATLSRECLGEKAGLLASIQWLICAIISREQPTRHTQGTIRCI